MDGLAELCDVCGTALTAGEQLYALVPDSSAVHQAEPGLDGQRLIVACGPGHLAQLQDEYTRRPWADEELWAGQLARAIATASAGEPGAMTPATLLEATGLTRQQIERAITWQAEQQ